MKSSNTDSKRVGIATVLLCVMVVFLSVFTVMVYHGKRTYNDEPTDDYETGLISEDPGVSQSDVSSSAASAVSSQDAVVSEVSSAVESDTSSDVSAVAEKSDFIESPDNKSEYYMVVFTGNQFVMVYKKNAKGEYKIKFHMLLCSTGTSENPTKEGVYSITGKERWATLSGDRFGQYGCILSGPETYTISSTPFSKNKAWTMLDGGYENIGQANTKGDIQLCVRDARWIYDNMPVGTQVHVVNSDNPDAKSLTLPKRINKNGGWDPTDKWSKGNPYFE